MREYHKIQSIYKRNMEKGTEGCGKFIEGQWSLSEFEYLQHNLWTFTEKVDGTNIRILWDSKKIELKGKTDRAQIYAPLIAMLYESFDVTKLSEVFNQPVCLYGEGYGARIQKGGGNYRPDVGFILFDILIGEWWLKREDIEGIAGKFNISVVPIIGEGTLHDAVKLIKEGITSTFGDFRAEGLVLKPKTELFARNGQRIISKIKHRDF